MKVFSFLMIWNNSSKKQRFERDVLIYFQLTKNWFPAKEASLKRGYILELLYNLHKGHDPSILPAKSKSKPSHFGVPDNHDEENESKNVIEMCNWIKPFDGSTVTDIPQTKTCSPVLLSSRETFYTGGYDPMSSKCRNVFMSPIEVIPFLYPQFRFYC